MSTLARAEAQGFATITMTGERRAVLWLATALVALSLPALLDPAAVARGAALEPTPIGEGAWFVLAHAGLLYVWIPLVVVSSFAAVLGPGLVLVYAIGAARSAASLLLLGLAASTVLLSVMVELVELAIGAPLLGRAFVSATLLATIAMAVGTSAVARAERPAIFTGADRHVLAAAAFAPTVLLVALLPKFLWESFNGDGAHAYESARLLLVQAVPFWRPDAGDIASYPGFTTFLSHYPLAWFIRLFGEVEAAVRLPYLLFLSAGVYAGLLSLIDIGRSDRGVGAARWVCWLGLASYTVVMAFSATYDPNHADIALPGTQDTLVIAWFLGFAWAFLERRTAWMAVFLALTFTTAPAGAVLLGIWFIAAMLVIRPVPVRPLIIAGTVLAICFVSGRLAPLALTAMGLPAPGQEHAMEGLTSRLTNLQWRDWWRAVYVIVPGGILPALSLVLVSRQDRVSMVLTVVTLAYFLFFYVQARSALHYFAPAMLLPLVVFWRTARSLPGQRYLTTAAVGAAAAAMLLSWPEHPGPHVAARELGSTVEDRLSGYDRVEASAFRRSELLHELFPYDSHHSVPDSAYGGSPIAWFHYARRDGPSPSGNYRLDAAGVPAPADWRLVASRDGVALYVLDESVLASHREMRWPSTIARIYRMSRHTLFAG